MGSPVDISVFGGYFPFATRFSLDVPAMFKYYGLDNIWAEAYGEVDNVTWLSTSAWDPCHLFTVNKPVRSLADMKGLRVFGVPTAGRFMAKYGLIPVIVPWDDVEVAMQTGELDGVCWCGFTEAYEVGWADICNYALTNSVTGAWFGSYFANSKSWGKLSPKLQELFKMSIDQSHYYRQVWYWGGEADLRVNGKKMELTQAYLLMSGVRLLRMLQDFGMKLQVKVQEVEKLLRHLNYMLLQWMQLDILTDN